MMQKADVERFYPKQPSIICVFQTDKAERYGGGGERTEGERTNEDVSAKPSGTRCLCLPQTYMLKPKPYNVITLEKRVFGR